jgi:SagB-type dehydrogenase family enzyme
MLRLPPPKTKGEMSLEEALSLRKTVRALSDEEIDLPAVSQLLWALQGVTWVEKPSKGKSVSHRTAPSAGKTFPLEIYVALKKGLFRYESRRHALCQLKEKDVRIELSKAAFTQLNKEAIQKAPLTIIVTADNIRALKATSLLENAVRFVHLEAGHATQNLILQATSMGLGACTITSYNIAAIYEALEIPYNHRPIYLIPIGMPEKT